VNINVENVVKNSTKLEKLKWDKWESYLDCDFDASECDSWCFIGESTKKNQTPKPKTPNLKTLNLKTP
jgi:hypothetical protein